MGKHLEAVLWSRTGFPDLLTPAEAAKLIYVSEERLLDLAVCGFAPCALMDKTRYFFFKKDILEWAKTHLFEMQSGSKLTIEVMCTEQIKADPFEVPQCLVALADKLKTTSATRSGPCIYFLVENGEVVYVGQSTNLSGRLGQHVGIKPFDQVFYFLVPEDHLFEVENSLIKFLRPRLNISGKGQVGNLEPWHQQTLTQIGLTTTVGGV